MSEWSGGFGDGTRPENARIPVKVHRNVSLVLTADHLVSNELLARPQLSRFVIGRLTDQILLVKPDHAPDVVDELKKMGHTPKIVGSR